MRGTDDRSCHFVIREDKYRYSDMNVRLHKFQYTKANKNDLKEMEMRMMTQQTLEGHAESFISSEGQERGTAWYQNQHYQLFPIIGTPFSLGIIHSENYPTTYIISREQTCFNIGKAFELVTTLWNRRIAISNLIAEYVKQYELKKESGERCFCMDTLDGIKNNTIFTDIILSESFDGVFKDTTDDVNQFIISNAGIVYYKRPPFEMSSSYTNVTHHDLMIYRRVFRAHKETMFVSMPYKGVMNITKEVGLSECNVTSCKVAVVGVQVPEALFISRVFGNGYIIGRQMLVNENGMIVYDSSGIATHSFIGKRFGWLTRELVKFKIYNKITYYECIDYCQISTKLVKFLTNSAQRLTLTILKFAWDICIFLLNQLKFITVVFLSILSPISGKHHGTRTACCRTYHHLQRNFSVTIDKSFGVKGPAGCRYKVYEVKNTNLVLINFVKHSKCIYGVPMSNTHGTPTNLAAIGIEKCQLVHEGDNISLGSYAEYGKFAQYYVRRKTCRLGTINSSETICVKSGALNDFLWNGFLVGSITLLFALKVLL